MLQKCEGIVIRTTDYGETNKIVTLYTREWGKVGVMARGSKKNEKSPFSDHPAFHLWLFSNSKRKRSRELAAG